MSSVTDTLVVSFGSSGSETGHLSAAFDTRTDGLNGGASEFEPGDTAYFFVWQSANVTHDTPEASAGSIVSTTVDDVEQSEELEFTGGDTATLSRVAESLTSWTWQGQDLGDLTLVDEQTVQAETVGVARAVVTYNTRPAAYGVALPATVAGSTEYNVTILIRGRQAT